MSAGDALGVRSNLAAGLLWFDRMTRTLLGFASLAALAVSFSTGCATPDGITWKTVFQTPDARMGNLGGLAGGDRICNDDAASAGLPGTYVAWLSTAGVNAIDRIAIDGPWLDPQYSEEGAVEVFASRADIAAGNVENPIGSPGRSAPTMYAMPGAWTGTTNRGQGTGIDCNAWTSTGVVPDPPAKGNFGEFTIDIPWNVSWSALAVDEPGYPPAGPDDCSYAKHLYCFQND